ncbi:hypothetical protein EFM54_12765, partial [Lentilactobacillus buchneri]|uniref:hypothetical protein n=1 Tax=Lentilactobacillus buchneri TaxID=1581 RepID=UPI0021A2659B
HNELLANADDQGIIQSILSDYLQEQWPDTFDSIEITKFEANQQQRITSLEATVTLTTGETVTSSISVDDQGDEDDAANG